MMGGGCPLLLGLGLAHWSAVERELIRDVGEGNRELKINDLRWRRERSCPSI
jgi:hypothetical protein